MKRPILLALTAAQIAFAGGAAAEELRLGMAPAAQTPWGATAEAFAAKVEELTGGDLTVSVYFNNELGDEQTMARQLARGGSTWRSCRTSPPRCWSPNTACCSPPTPSTRWRRPTAWWTSTWAGSSASPSRPPARSISARSRSGGW